MSLLDILSRSSEAESFLSFGAQTQSTATPLQPLGEDEDMACTQFASTQRFAAFRRKSMEDSNDAMEEDSGSSKTPTTANWLDPCEWEESSSSKRQCSCRKTMTGKVVHMLNILFQSWSKLLM